MCIYIIKNKNKIKRNMENIDIDKIRNQVLI